MLTAAHQNLRKSFDEETEGFRRSEKAARRIDGSAADAEKIRRRIGEEETGKTGGRVSKVSPLLKKFWPKGMEGGEQMLRRLKGRQKGGQKGCTKKGQRGGQKVAHKGGQK